MNTSIEFKGNKIINTVSLDDMDINILKNMSIINFNSKDIAKNISNLCSVNLIIDVYNDGNYKLTSLGEKFLNSIK